MVGLVDDAPEDQGRNPWDTWPPFLLDVTAAEEFGYRPVGTYAETVRAEVDWLCALPVAARQRLNHDVYFREHFDYAEEDRILAQSNIA